MGELVIPRVLFGAFSEVPGPNCTGTRIAQWLSVFGNKSTDALSLKGARDPHIQRLGGARVMRVPNTLDRPFAERLSTYQRALVRQLAGEAYDLIWCADLATAAVVQQAAPSGVPVVVEVYGSAAAGLSGAAQRRQDSLEREALKAAALALVPSRYAARQLGGRANPRSVVVAPRCVDRSVFSPPSVEVAMDNEQRVLVFGGREGGARLDRAVAALQKLKARAPETARLDLMGVPTPRDAEVRAALQKAGLGDRVELVDADSPLAVSAALSLAHVVVVLADESRDGELAAVPHRALEAMACGRAVVLAGTEAAFAEAVSNGEDCVVVPDNADRVAEAALTLLGQQTRRDAMARAAGRTSESNADLATRSAELAAHIEKGTGVALRFHAPRDDDGDTSSRSQPEPRAFARARPRPAPRPPQTVAEVRAAPPASPSEPSGPLRAAQEPVPTELMPAPMFSQLEQPTGLWEGDTFLDSNSGPRSLTNPDAAQVKAAMLHSSESGRAAAAAAAGHLMPAPQADAARTAADSIPSALAEDVLALSPMPTMTSVRVRSSLDSLEPVSADAQNPWVNDTIADGTPVELQRLSGERSLQRPTLAKGLLADGERRRDDLTAEDPSESGTSSADLPPRK